MTKNSLFRLSQYDVTQQIIETLANVYSRGVLFSVTSKAKDAQAIADELKMSISTVYKILSNLEDLTLVYVDKYVISAAGKKIKFYKSRIKKAEIIVGSTRTTKNVTDWVMTGAHVITIIPSVLRAMVLNARTKETVMQFTSDALKSMKEM